MALVYASGKNKNTWPHPRLGVLARIKNVADYRSTLLRLPWRFNRGYPQDVLIIRVHPACLQTAMIRNTRTCMQKYFRKPLKLGRVAYNQY